MFTVILSDMAEVSIDAACCIPARNAAGAAMAAASNKRLMVIPPDVRATGVVEPVCAPEASIASLTRGGSEGGVTTGSLSTVDSLGCEETAEKAVEVQ